MPNYYTYLISSLPTLKFGEKPPFSYEGFLAYCKNIISDSDIALLGRLAEIDIYDYKGDQLTLKRYRAFEIALRNELVVLRAARKRVEATSYIRADGESGISLNHIATHAFREPHILEGETTLDIARWEALTELSIGHYFDIDTLVIYGLKLLLLEKWERIRGADRTGLLEEALSGKKE